MAKTLSLIITLIIGGCLLSLLGFPLWVNIIFGALIGWNWDSIYSKISG